MRDAIIGRLARVEREKDVRILFACEAGSRAWGFASPDSDWDVRFIYVRPRDWYLSFDVEHKRDVIECAIENDLDANGWDLRKALYLFTRTNGALIEWLHSPIVYIDRDNFGRDLCALSDTANMLNMTALCYHYSHMARGNAREYLQGDEVRLKKYLYVIRPLLAIRWIVAFNSVPPVTFANLMGSNVCPEWLKPELSHLLERKAVTPELGVGAPYKELNRFIEAELSKHESLANMFKGQGRPTTADDARRQALNTFFRSALK